MGISEGVYAIRFVPPHVKPPFVGGVYATGESINAPILAHAQNPSLPGEQHWHVRPIGGKKDTYAITYPGFQQSNISTGVGPVLPGFGLGTKKNYYIDNILLTVDIAEWIVTQVDAEQGVFNISEPPNGMVGATKCIDNNNGVLVLATFPVVQDMPPLPRWQFMKTK